MILTIYGLFLALAIVAVCLAYFTGDNFHAFVGLIILFYLGVIMLTGALSIPAGTASTSNYSYIVNTSDISGITTTESITYTLISDTYTRTLGLALALAAGFGAFLLFSRKNLKDGDE